MKRFFLLALCFLLLSACTPNTPLFTEALVKGMDTKSFESKSTITLDTNLPVEDETAKTLLATLKSGVTMQVEQKDQQNGHVTISLQDPGPLMDSGVWPSEKEPALDLYVEGDKTYVKSTADNKFLGITNDADSQAAAQLGASEKKLFEAFLKQQEFSLKDVQTVGEETVQLPDGKVQTATHVRISVDFQEAVDFIAFALDYASKHPELTKAFENNPLIPVPGAESGSDNLKDSLSEMVKELKSADVKKLQAEGWDFHIVLDAWINADKEFVQNQFTVTGSLPASTLSESGVAAGTGMKSVTFTLKLKDQMWNINKDVTYSVPQADQVIMAEELEKNPELAKEFGEESLIGQFASMGAGPEEPAFVDVPETHWAYHQIGLLKDMGVVNGYADGEFKPNRPVTRSEFITMAVKALGLEPSAKKLSFKDNNQIPAWSKESWQTAVQSGLVKGYADGTIRPDQKISRAEMITILVRGLKMPTENGYKLNYADTKQIPAWAVPYVKTASANGLVKGDASNRFAPQKNASRAEVATVLFNSIFGDMPTE
ncbi:S-layer homology domain-containing protein [Brevibacillus sp. NRS-1366]|uniref:S-layer homology domain-containing protein n=1 Tax=Brevibacillus sp. NRS-1366 TaxID=3233899 RepID=UPI003D20EB7E